MGRGSEAARQAGQTTYDTGKPCKHGHRALRWSCDGGCCECTKLKLERKRRAQGMEPHLGLRAAAKARSDRTFNTGKPCVHGHLAARWTQDGKCVECSRLASKAAYAVKDPVKHRAQGRAWEEKNRDKVRVNALKAYYRNHEENRAKGRQRYHDNLVSRLTQRSAPAVKARKKQTKQQWEAANPERKRLAQARYRVLVAGAPGRITPEEVIGLLEVQNYQCAGPHCDVEFLRGGYAVDHKQPLSRQGENTIENVQLLCKSCNSSKGAKTMEEWAVWLLKTGRLGAHG